jgi:hypothetical protein
MRAKMDVSKVRRWKWGELGSTQSKDTTFYVTDADIPAIATMTGRSEPPIIVQDEPTAKLVCDSLNAGGTKR